MDQKEKYRIKKTLAELAGFRGRHTELISIYVPAGGNLNDLRNQIIQESSTAQNIKSKTTRKNVITALEKVSGELKFYKKTPPNGLVIFCGNVSKIEGKDDFRLWIFEPPEPISVRLYRCDQEFILEPLKQIMEAKNIYGLIVMDNSEAAIGLLKGKAIITITEMDSIVPGKFRKGGQSAHRFEQVRENLANDWYKKIAETAKNAFADKDIKGIIIGGPGPVKDTFVNGGYLMTDLKNKIIAVKDIGYSNASGLNELVNRSSDVLAKEEVVEEKNILNLFFEKLSTDIDMISYGEDEVKNALSLGAVDKLLVSEDLEMDKMDRLMSMGEKSGAEVVVISSDTREGKQFLELGGIGAFLRFKIR